MSASLRITSASCTIYLVNNLDLKKWLSTGSINIFGRPFAGKDTQGEKLTTLFEGTLLGGGDILRNSHIPDHVDKALHRGELIPSEDYVSIVLPFLSKPEFAGKPLILSSVGRWKGEEAGVIDALKSSNHDLKAVIYLELSEDDVVQRWRALEEHDNRGGRYDDTEEILKKRLEEYRNKTIPVIDRYEELGLLERIDGIGTPHEVYTRIIEALRRRASAYSSN